MPRSMKMSLGEAATKVGVHPATIVRWIDTRKVRLKKKKDASGHYVFTQTDVEILRQHKTSVRPVG